MHRPTGAECQRLAQGLTHAIRTETVGDHLTAMLLGDLQRRFERDLVAFVDRERQVLFVDPAPVLGDAQARFGIRHLLDADRNLHLGNPLGKCCPSRERYARPHGRVNAPALSHVEEGEARGQSLRRHASFSRPRSSDSLWVYSIL
jgi:hypothetical protein